MSTICLYFPYIKTGGVSSLFAFIANLISLKTNVYIVDYPNGALSNLCRQHQVNRILPDDLTNLSYDHDLIIVSQALPLWRLPHLTKLKPSTRLFFWFLHPDNFEIIPKFRLFFEKYNFLLHKRNLLLRSQYSLLYKSNSIYFMDLACHHGLLSTLRLSSTSQTLDRPILRLVHNPTTFSCETRDSLYSPDTLTITWIGRLEDFKSQSLLAFVLDLSESTFNSLYDIRLHIVGDGIDARSLQSALDALPLHITFHGTLSFDELDDLLVTTDIGFAMGLSLLEFTSRSIPCLIADFGYHLTQSTSYSLFGEERFDLGCPYDVLIHIPHDKQKSLTSSIDYIVHDYKNISTMTVNAYLTTYYYQSTIPAFEKALSLSRLTVGDVVSQISLSPDLTTTLVSSISLLRNQLFSALQRSSIYGGFSWLL